MWDGLSPPSQVCSLTEKLVLCVHKVFHSLEKMGEKSVYELSLLSRSVFIFLCPLITFMLQGYSCISSFFIFLVAKMCPDMLLHLILLFLLVWWWTGLFFFFSPPQEWFFSVWKYWLAKVSSPGACRQAKARRDRVSCSWGVDKV